VPFRRNECLLPWRSVLRGIGDEFEELERKDSIINADCAGCLVRSRAVGRRQNSPPIFSFAIKTIPARGMRGDARAIGARARLRDDCILPGAGSSDLIFAGLRHGSTPRSRVLVLDPM